MALLECGPTERNKDPILDVLRDVLPSQGQVLEIASGGGQHVVHFAKALPGLQWQPSDLSAEAHESIIERTALAGLSNIAPPLFLDVVSTWPALRVDAVITANLLHVAPIEATEGLCGGAASVLSAGGLLHVYGPFKREGKHNSPGNVEFDERLRERDPRLGIRDLEQVITTAASHGLGEVEITPMPANNFSVLLRRR